MEEFKQLTEIKELEELENKCNKVREEPKRYSVESQVEPVEISELEEYIKLTDEEKQDKYSKEQQASTDKLIEIIEKTNQQVDELTKQINNKAIEAYKAVVVETKKIEEEIEANNKLISELDEQIKELKEQIAIKEQDLAQLELTEDYDKEEYAKLQKDIEELKNELNVKEKMKEVKTKTNNKHKDQLEALQSTKQELAEEYKVVQHHIEIEDLTEKWREVEANRRKKFSEYKQLQQTEKYKNKDEETLKKANQLAKEILLANDDESKIANKQKELNQLINELTGREVVSIVREEKQPDINTEETLEKVEKEEEEKTNSETTPPEQSEDTANDTVENESKEESTKGKEAKTSKGKENAQNITVPQAQEVVSKDVSKKEVDPKEEFEGLCYKAKNGKLKDEEFDKLVEILKDPTSYDKFGIRTVGPAIFNKSKRIFKSLEKYIGNTSVLLAEAKEQFAKEIEGNLSGKELLTKIAELDKEDLTEVQQITLEKVKARLNRQETLEQAKYVRDKIALEKAQKHWFWSVFYDVEAEVGRLAKAEKTYKEEKTEKPKSGEIKGLTELENSEEEKNKFNSSYEVTSKEPKTTDTKEY